MRNSAQSGKMALTALAAILVAGCTSTQEQRLAEATPAATATVSAYSGPPPFPVDDGMAEGNGTLDNGALGTVALSAYGPVEDGGFLIPAVPAEQIDPKYLRQRVVYDRPEYAPGTIVVDTANRFLYLVEDGGTAMRYGIGVGRSGFSWKGTATIEDKQHWPKWFPPDEMIERQPELQPYDDGMEPGLQNPLGSRALYLYQDGKDTLYRLHGTPQWQSIGTAASSGCIRLMNQDIIDLYERVPLGAKVVVLQGEEALVAADGSPSIDL